MAEQMPDLTDTVGSIEMGVDESGFARSIDILLSFTAEDEPGSIRITAKSKPLPAGITVDPPPANQVTSTKSVTTMDELGTAMQAATA